MAALPKHLRLIEEIEEIEEERLVPSSPDGASSLQEDAALDPAPSIKVFLSTNAHMVAVHCLVGAVEEMLMAGAYLGALAAWHVVQ
jgi:hypothetical protein